ncbi:MAG: 3-deoxy-8-phosphooctulonate synthase [Gammaproteobacteria bacterium]|nr:3-deoxy-8-phosphooctulonate synthase [Gammaproteobacteria bacterium]MDH4254632.1 3-deoxy-8-phosphooctulonate synthase [Gammaproteobacteria bacterium]MDH5309460.1 3-deoxy-8-phosphooctulonate synthase [Gammaproteobacteria bacterium]
MTAVKHVDVAGIDCGSEDLFLISGPCVIEAEPLMMKTAERLKEMSERLKLPVVFKSSFSKDNRSSLDYFQGPGLEEGLKVLAKIKSAFDLPLLTDIHYPTQAAAAGEVVDIVQIPAYLCMQSELVVAAAKTGKVVNLKHGQFIAPDNMAKPVKKVEASGNDRILLTERGYTFGYNDLIVDPRSFFMMREIGYPVIFDITHTIRKYGIPSKDPRGGTRQYLKVLARAGVAAGVDGIFVETHPNPPEALCDAASQYYLDDLEEFLKPLMELHQLVRPTLT